MDQNNGANGNPNDYVVMLRMDRDTLEVKLDTEVHNIDTIMNMLATALRFLDVQYRVAAGIKAQEAYKQRQQDMQVAQAILSRRKIAEAQ